MFSWLWQSQRYDGTSPSLKCNCMKTIVRIRKRLMWIQNRTSSQQAHHSMFLIQNFVFACLLLMLFELLHIKQCSNVYTRYTHLMHRCEGGINPFYLLLPMKGHLARDYNFMMLTINKIATTQSIPKVASWKWWEGIAYEHIVLSLYWGTPVTRKSVMLFECLILGNMTFWPHMSYYWLFFQENGLC